MYTILGMGNALTDVLIKLEDDKLLEELGLPRGSMQLIDQNQFKKLQGRVAEMPKQLVCGGSAANTITGLAKLGVKTAFLGKIHQDKVGENYQKDLIGSGVTPFLLEDEMPSGQATVFISPDGERTFATFLGAAAQLIPEDLDPALFSAYDLFYIEGYLVQNHDLISKAVHLARQAGMKVALDLASFNVVDANRTFLEKLINEQVDIVFANEEEAFSLTGSSPELAFSWFQEQTATVIIKTGRNGAMGKQGGQLIRVPAVKANCIDTTGAGDLFAAGFLYGMTTGQSLEVCLRYGTISAGKVIECIGPRLNQQAWDSVMTAF